MKRLIFIASLAMLAVGCQKTEIQNEVQTPIGFSTEVGKQTRAIADATTYSTSQPFAVYAYGWQDNAANQEPVMSNVEVSQQERTNGNDQVDVWAATGNVKYYWPNDPTTTLNFYAYSPAAQTENASTSLAAHQGMTFAAGDGNGVSHDETQGLKLTNYTHTNMYVDFMVATPVLGATYSEPDANGNNQDSDGTVPMLFNHQMTQILFNVTTDKVYPGVTFTVEEITLKNIKDQGTYTHASLTPSYTNDPQTSAFTHGVWSGQTVMTGEGTFTIFPADVDNGALVPNGREMSDADNTVEKEIALTYAADATDASALATMTTTGVTMIPQDMVAATTTPEAGDDSYESETTGQMFMIQYSISGTGVAEETVVKHVPFRPNNDEVVNWGVNKKITYTVKIGLKEILFEPSVADWTAETGNEYTFQQ